MTDERYRTGTILLGKLAVIRRIGSGAMGAVYEVEHRLTRHRRALKVLHPDLAQRGSVVARLVREAGVAGRLGSARVVESYDAGVLEDGSPYVLMELLRGRSLASELSVRERLDPASAATIAIQICEGMQAAHDAGIVHRDLKPGNLFVLDGESWSIKILDFGVAKLRNLEDQPPSVELTRSGTVLGTPRYMSPEQAGASADVDHRTDIYALGVILYECLTGRVPYQSSSFVELIAQLHVGVFPKLREIEPSLPAELEAIVHRAFARDPKDRHPTMSALAADLAPFATGAVRTAASEDATLGDAEVLTTAALTLQSIDDGSAAEIPAIGKPPPSTKRTSLVVASAVGIVGAVALGAFAKQWIESPNRSTPAPVVVQRVVVPTAPSIADAGGQPVSAPSVPSAPSRVERARPRWPRATKAGLPSDNPYGEP